MSKDDSKTQQVPIFVPTYPQAFPGGWSPQPPQYVQAHAPAVSNDRQKMISYNLPGMKRPFGQFSDFLFGLFFGTVAPFFSQLTTHAFETSRLTRIGTFFGSANVLLIGAWCIMGLGFQAAVPREVPQDPTPPMMMDLHDPNVTVSVDIDQTWEEFTNSSYDYTPMWILLAIALFVLIVAFGFLRKAGQSFAVFLNDYQHAELESHEAVTVTSELGSRRDYTISLIVTLFFPMIGGFLRLWLKPTLKSKYGIMKGFALHFLLWAAFQPVLILPALIFYQIADVHFRRALVCAGEAAPAVCMSRWRRQTDASNVAINA